MSIPEDHVVNKNSNKASWAFMESSLASFQFCRIWIAKNFSNIVLHPIWMHWLRRLTDKEQLFSRTVEEVLIACAISGVIERGHLMGLDFLCKGDQLHVKALQ